MNTSNYDNKSTVGDTHEVKQAARPLLNLDNYIFDENNKLVGDKYLIKAKQKQSFIKAKKSLPKRRVFKKSSVNIPMFTAIEYVPKQIDIPHDLKYHEYIKSELWWARRQKYFREHVRQCAKCMTTANIVLHHIKYAKSSYGKELDKDLVALCATCHNSFHTIYGVHTDMHKMHRKWLRQ